jgi:hypothetical protein
MDAAAKVSVVAAWSWMGLQRPRLWVVAVTQAMGDKALAAVAKALHFAYTLK